MKLGTWSRIGGALAAILWIAGAWPATSFAAIGDKPSLESILERAESASSETRGILAKELVDLGSSIDGRLFDALVEDAARGRDFKTARPDVLLRAFVAMGPARWRPVLASRLDSAQPVSAVKAILAIEERAGYAEDLPLALYAAGLDRDGVCHASLETTLLCILLRDSAGFGTIDSTIPGVSVELRSIVVRAVEQTKKPAAAVLLARWIASRREMRSECLPHLARLSLSLDKPLSPDVIGPVRALVEDGDETIVREAVLCAGRLGDTDVVPALIRCLKEGEFGLRMDALWALRSISGLKFSEDPAEWTRWFEAESRFWADESRDSFARLVAGSKAEKMATLCAVSKLYGWRERIVAEITIALDDADTDVALLTVS